MVLDLATATREELTELGLRGIGKARIERFLDFRTRIGGEFCSDTMQSFPDWAFWQPHVADGTLMISNLPYRTPLPATGQLGSSSSGSSQEDHVEDPELPDAVAASQQPLSQTLTQWRPHPEWVDVLADMEGRQAVRDRQHDEERAELRAEFNLMRQQHANDRLQQQQVNTAQQEQLDAVFQAQRELTKGQEDMRQTQRELFKAQDDMRQSQKELAKMMQALLDRPVGVTRVEPADVRPRVRPRQDPLAAAMPLAEFGRFLAGEEKEVEAPARPKEEPRPQPPAQDKLLEVIAARERQHPAPQMGRAETIPPPRDRAQQVGRVENIPPPPPRDQAPVAQPPAVQPVRMENLPRPARIPEVPPSKLPMFDGKAESSTGWSAFILKFERVAARQQWPDDVRLDRLIECLTDVALQYFCKLPEEVREDYGELRQRLQLRFALEETPSVARRKLQEAKQGPEESLEVFAGRIQMLATSGYPATPMATIHAVSVDAFFKGCRERLAAFMAMNSEPATIEQALRLMKGAVTNQATVLGPGPPITKVRQVLRFDDTVPEEPQIRALRGPSDLEAKVSKVEQYLSELNLQMGQRLQQILDSLERMDPTRHENSERMGRNSSPRRPWVPRSRSPSPARSGECFNCRKPGHFSRECPERQRSRSPSPRPRPSNGRGLNK